MKLKTFFFSLFILIVMLGQLQCTHWSKRWLQNPSSKLAVIIGPGGARTLSSIGILQSLMDHNISVDVIMGIGWGAWIAAVFSKNQSVEEVKWSFHKLSKRGLFEQTFLKHPLITKNIDVLEADLTENFPDGLQTKIPFACPVLTDSFRKKWDRLRWIPAFAETTNQEGNDRSVRSSVKSCLLLPPFFKINTSKSIAAPFSIQNAMSYLQSQNIDQVIWIHSMKDASLFPKKFRHSQFVTLWSSIRQFSNQMASQLQNVWVVTPSLESFYVSDFSKINDIIGVGEKEGEIMVEKFKIR